MKTPSLAFSLMLALLTLPSLAQATPAFDFKAKITRSEVPIPDGKVAFSLHARWIDSPAGGGFPNHSPILILPEVDPSVAIRFVYNTSFELPIATPGIAEMNAPLPPKLLAMDSPTNVRLSLKASLEGKTVPCELEVRETRRISTVRFLGAFLYENSSLGPLSIRASCDFEAASSLQGARIPSYVVDAYLKELKDQKTAERIAAEAPSRVW